MFVIIYKIYKSIQILSNKLRIRFRKSKKWFWIPAQYGFIFFCAKVNQDVIQSMYGHVHDFDYTYSAQQAFVASVRELRALMIR